ncbi:MAG: CBS domain-containing protein [Bdellovibrionaceae bacterium]|nr:CBS domain-containing protein [Pseudobdellovibrionaceae bacterium]MBX3032358.1 CBS domain-containing protein [Pseudobdellovibrionaceae bacterium]
MEANVPLVGELMSPAPPNLRSDRTLEEAAQFFRENRVSVAPVITPAGNFVAVMSEFQLVKFFLKRSQETPNNLFVGNYVNDMEPPKIIEELQTVTEAFRQMVEAPSRRVFVLRAGQIVGVVEPNVLYDFLIARDRRAP